jgi:hypothetical protein
MNLRLSSQAFRLGHLTFRPNDLYEHAGRGVGANPDSEIAGNTDSLIVNSNNVAQILHSDKTVVAHHSMDG